MILRQSIALPRLLAGFKGWKRGKAGRRGKEGKGRGRTLPLFSLTKIPAGAHYLGLEVYYSLSLGLGLMPTTLVLRIATVSEIF